MTSTAESGPRTDGGPSGRIRALRAAGGRAVPVVEPSVPRRRRWGRVGAGVALVLAGGLVTASLFSSVDDRVQVLVLQQDVARYETITASDVGSVRIGTGESLVTLPTSKLDEVVGRVAAMDLTEGALLAPDQMVPVGERLVAPGEAVVGMLLSSSDAPLGQLESGREVFVVVRPAGGGDSDDVEVVAGWVLDTSGSGSGGERSVAVVVPAGEVGEVSAAAGDGRVTLSVREGG